MRIENKTVTEDVSLDHNQFVNVEFKDCKVLYHGGPFYLENVRFTNVQYVLSGAANDTLLYLRFLKSLGNGIFDSFMSKQDAAGPQGETKKLN